MNEDKITCKGIVQLNRTFGGRQVMFGSSIEHDTAIKLTISTGEEVRSFSNKRYRPVEEIIEVELSPSQYAELITTLNYGVGVPCTITRFQGERIPNNLKIDDEIEIIKKEYEDNIKESFVKAKQMIKSINDAKPLSPKKTRELKDSLLGIIFSLEREAPFMKERFDETIDQTVAEVKAAIDDRVNLVINNLGKEMLRDKEKLNIENKEE